MVEVEKKESMKTVHVDCIPIFVSDEDDIKTVASGS